MGPLRAAQRGLKDMGIGYKVLAYLRGRSRRRHTARVPRADERLVELPRKIKEVIQILYCIQYGG